MISEGDTSCFTNGLPQDLNNMYGDISQDLAVPVAVAGATDTHCTSLLYNLSVLNDKVHHLQSLVTVLIAPDPPPPRPQQNQHESTASSMVMASISTLVQEVIVTASSMMFTCQQMGMAIVTQQPIEERGGQQGSYSCDQQNLDWYGDNIYNPHTISIYSNNTEVEGRDQEHAQSQSQSQKNEGNGGGGLGKGILVNNCEDIIELEASDILAKYTHYCHVCGKGFKRDANLRMHMRAHGDEYKSPAALTNPMKKISSHGNSKEDDLLLSKPPRKYSCPQEGCRWNRKHAKFQPLKSMICVKNHYKRSHCPKMYVCKRCNQKQFSVLSDLRTHEKHCGDLKWLCSCGTTFSRKDKLMGHVALFVGHTPAISSSTATR